MNSASDGIGFLSQMESAHRTSLAKGEVGGGVRLPLWKAMREYLLAEGESRVADIAAYLESKDYKNLSRQTIESAIKRHRETFSVRTRKRERVVFLKTAEEGRSSSDDD